MYVSSTFQSSEFEREKVCVCIKGDEQFDGARGFRTPMTSILRGFVLHFIFSLSLDGEEERTDDGSDGRLEPQVFIRAAVDGSNRETDRAGGEDQWNVYSRSGLATSPSSSRQQRHQRTACAGTD